MGIILRLKNITYNRYEIFQNWIYILPLIYAGSALKYSETQVRVVNGSY